MADEYKVEKKEEIRRLNKAMEVDTYYRIWVTTKKGTYFHVDILETDLAKSPDILLKRAKELDSI